jgi:hypothetical protein
VRDVHEIEGEEPVEHVDQEIGRLEDSEPAQHVEPTHGGDRVHEARSKRQRFRRGGVRERPGCEGQADGAAGEERSRHAPADTGVDRGRDDQRSGDVTERSCKRPARHVALARMRRQVHQRRLRERDERTRCRIADDQCDEQHPKARCCRGKPC